MKRTALLLLVLSCVLVSPASAYFRASGSGSGTGATETLGAGQQPSGSANGRTVSLNWTQTAFHGGVLGSFTGGGYVIRRYPTGGATAVVPSGACGATVSGGGASLSCTEPNVPFGLWRYSVGPVLGAPWTGAESPRSTDVRVAPDAPTGVTATAATAARVDVAFNGVTGATSYAVYRRAGSGALTLLTTVTGTTYADTATTNGTVYGYVIRAVAPAATGGTIDSANSSEATATADSAPPTNVVLANPGAAIRDSVTLSATASDNGTGVASVRFQYTPAGAGNWQDICVDTDAPYICSGDSTLVADGLYDLRATATDFVGYTTTSAVVANRRVDNTAPTATLTNPGSPLRGTIALSSTASDGGSGLASVKVQRSPAGAGTWTDICTGTTTASPCSFATTAVPDGDYDLRVQATDAAGNQATDVVATRRVDNTKPTGTSVQTTNRTGGIAGRPETGDSLALGFSEPIAPASVLAGWTGAATPVTVRISAANPGVLQVYNAANSAALPLGTVNLGKAYASAALTFTGSTMTMSGSTVTVTLGTSALGGVAVTGTGTGTLSWTTVATPTDLAGNTLTAGTVAEAGAADLDF